MRKPEVDKRALIVGMAGSLFFSMITAWTYYSPWWTVLDNTYGTRRTTSALVACIAFGCLAVPAVVSALARDRPFAWGLLPLALFWVSVAAAQTHGSGWASVARTLPDLVAIAGGSLLISSGPVTLVRMVLDDRKRAAEEQARWGQRQAARQSPEEVWPPPPEDKA
jgi:hypothetical protein